MIIFKGSKTIQTVIDRVWSSEDPDQIKYRNTLFPRGKPSVYIFMLRLHSEVMLKALRRNVCKFLLLVLFGEKVYDHQDNNL